ncbi:MAG TPA: hypothetical protein VK897_21130 [Anaerolineales bacterium]|nr:hypothetical protein [Anaerolineales bacterium]
MPLKIKTLRISLYALFLLALFTSLFFYPEPGFALENVETLPGFSEFSESVQNNTAGVLRGVYVPDVLAFPVIQQPAAEPGFVSPMDGEITQFGMASQFGTVGLLAHNNLSGRFFSQLAVGQEVRLVYGDGKVEYFVITEILQYQALQPTSRYSTFRDLTNNELLTTDQMFKRVYAGDRHVTFQTCIAGPGSLSWGRLFVIAMPRPQYSGFPQFGPH